MPVRIHRFEHPLHWAEHQLHLSKALKAQLKRVALHALALLSMGSVLTALIALRAAISLWHLNA